MKFFQQSLFDLVIGRFLGPRARRGVFGPDDLLVEVSRSHEVESGIPQGRARKETPLVSEHHKAVRAVYDQYKLGEKGFRLSATYYRYSGLTHTVRAHKNKMHIRISHHFREQPEEIIEAVTHILIRKLLRLPQSKHEVQLCREAETRLLESLSEQSNGRKAPARPSRHCRPPLGRHYNLEEIVDRLSNQYFDGQFTKIPVYWSTKKARRYWGKYYPDPPRIVINSRLDSPRIPRYVVEAVLHHEMLHHVIGVRTVDGRKRAHTREFREAERSFPHYTRAEAFLMRMA